MHRTAWLLAALFLIAPASAQQVTGILVYDGPVAVDATPGDTVVLEGVVERSCPPGYLAGPAVTQANAAAPEGYAVTTEAPAFEQQVCTLEPTQRSPLRVTVSVPADANASVTHAIPIWIKHPDQQLPYPPMTFEDLHVDLLVDVGTNASSERASTQQDQEPASVATPPAGPLPVLAALAVAAVALRRL